MGLIFSCFTPENQILTPLNWRNSENKESEKRHDFHVDAHRLA